MTNKTQTYTTSPVPESVRVDPQSVASEYMISLLPKGAPRPVFSTMALMHGKNASGAKALREGFAWNSQMDLLWALGFPKVLLIVDGFPTDETPDTLLDYWNPKRATQLQWWFQQAEVRNPIMLSRRGVFAVLSELVTMRNPLTLGVKKFLAVTEPRDITANEAREYLLNIASSDWDPDAQNRAALVLEALVGPTPIVDALCSIIESNKFNKSKRYAALSLLRPMRRRVTESDLKSLNDRLKKIGSSTEPAQTLGLTLQVTIDPLMHIKKRLDEGKQDQALLHLDWLDEPQALVAQCHAKRIKQKPSEPTPRTVFPGGEVVIKSEAAYYATYDRNYSIPAFADVYSTIQHPAITEMALCLSVDKEFGKKVPTWFAAHATYFSNTIASLTKSKDAKLSKAAKGVQKSMSKADETNATPTVKPATKAKPTSKTKSPGKAN